MFDSLKKKLATYLEKGQKFYGLRKLHFGNSNMVNFFTQPEIEAVLLTALLGVIGWAFLGWRKSRRGHKDLHGEAHVLASHAVTIYNVGNRTDAIAAAEKSLTTFEAVGDSAANVVRENLANWREQPQFSLNPGSPRLTRQSFAVSLSFKTRLNSAP